jgi:hypothetical protein
MEKICPLSTQQVEIAQLYSLVKPLGHLMTKSQKTDVYIRVELVYLKVDLWGFAPSTPAGLSKCSTPLRRRGARWARRLTASSSGRPQTCPGGSAVQRRALPRREQHTLPGHPITGWRGAPPGTSLSRIFGSIPAAW